jgi:hypothetical protein
MFDNKRLTYNPTNRPLFPNASDQEHSVNLLDFYLMVLNGEQLRYNE